VGSGSVPKKSEVNISFTGATIVIFAVPFMLIIVK